MRNSRFTSHISFLNKTKKKQIMKKLLTLAAAALFSLSTFVANAQTDKKDAKKADTKKEAVAPTDQKLKKDGTPDMRYKENKEAAKPAGPLKKDGTPDKRYKENKK